MTFIDTAEEYGHGEAEKTIARAIAGKRDQVFLATKVSSEHLGYYDVIRSVENSLRRLETDYVDLYQVHWTNPSVPIGETMAAMGRLVDQGKIRFAGICNCTMKELREARATMSSNKLCFAESEYNLVERTVERALIPYCSQNGMAFVAYSPLDQGRMTADSGKAERLNTLASKYGKTPSQLTLNWLVRCQNVIVIPQSVNLNHIHQNAAAADFDISTEDYEEIARLFAVDVVYVPVCRVRVYPEGEASQRVYRTKCEAMENRFNMTPSPSQLAEEIRAGEILKPVKVKSISDPTGTFEYELVDGRTRYWAWVIAHEGQKPVPAMLVQA